MDANYAARRSELQRVRDEVVEDLGKAGAIRVDQRSLLDLRVQTDSLFRRSRECGFDRLLHEQAEIRLPERELESAGVDLRDEEEVAHEPQEPLTVSIDDRKKFTLLGPRFPSSSVCISSR